MRVDILAPGTEKGKVKKRIGKGRRGAREGQGRMNGGRRNARGQERFEGGEGEGGQEKEKRSREEKGDDYQRAGEEPTSLEHMAEDRNEEVEEGSARKRERGWEKKEKHKGMVERVAHEEG